MLVGFERAGTLKRTRMSALQTRREAQGVSQRIPLTGFSRWA
jgi:hypothetical protein